MSFSFGEKNKTSNLLNRCKMHFIFLSFTQDQQTVDFGVRYLHRTNGENSVYNTLTRSLIPKEVWKWEYTALLKAEAEYLNATYAITPRGLEN